MNEKEIKMTNNMWWGYLNSNGTVQVKRWFGDHEDYTGDCYGNPFVVRVVKPFESDSYDEAHKYIVKTLQENN